MSDLFRIQSNIPALFSQRLLGQTNEAIARNQERLSSGLRINRAADDAAGLSISERFRTQTNGLFQAKRNIQDGLSLLQVAEGGLSTTTDMLQRMRTLAVQAASDTLTDADRALLQVEVDELLEEIDRQGSTVTFNNKALLTGAFAGASGQTNTFDSAGVVTADARPNYFEDPLMADPTVVAPGGGGFVTEFTNGRYTLASSVDATSYVAQTLAAFEETMRFQFNPGVTDTSLVTSLQFNFVGGSDVDLTVAGDGPAGTIRYQLYDFQASAWVDVGSNTTGISGGPFTAGVTTAQTSNPSRFFDASGDVWAQAFVDGAGANHELAIDYASLDVTTRSEGLILHIGANKDQTFEVFLPDARGAALGVSTVDISSQAGASASIDTIDAALDTLTSARAKIGAESNRLERTLSFVGIQAENQQAAESRIRDLDYAAEIVDFTKQQILQQAGTAALAQANVAPQTVLQLLR